MEHAKNTLRRVLHYLLDSSKSVEGKKYSFLGIETLMFCINMTYICVTMHNNLCFYIQIVYFCGH